MGKKYGGGAKYKAIWGRMAQIKENARLINEATAHGIDPISVELTDAPSRNPKDGQGSYVAALIQSLLAQRDYSASPLNLTISQLIFYVYFKSETAKLFGGGAKYHAVWSFMAQINGHASALREAYDSGIDPFTVELNNETAARGKKKTQGNHGRCLEWNFFCLLVYSICLFTFFSDFLLIPSSSFPEDGFGLLRKCLGKQVSTH